MIIGSTELIILIIPFLIIYFIPTIIAFSRNSPNKIGVFLLNLFLGFTFIGWIVAFIWAFGSRTKTSTIIVNNTQNEYKSEKSNHQQANTTDDLSHKLNQIERLKKLCDEGTISKEDFESQKEKIFNR